MTATPPFLTRVRIKNYKSIAACDVKLGRLAFLVGPNGSGKSNFLDALQFVGEALSTTIGQALRPRGGMAGARRVSKDKPDRFSIRLDFQTSDGASGHYSFEIAAHDAGGFSVAGEECSVSEPGTVSEEWFRIREGAPEPETSLDVAVPAVAHDRLYLVALSAITPFRAVYSALTRMCFYNLEPKAMRWPTLPEAGSLLRQNGGNLPSVLKELQEQSPATIERLDGYLNRIIPSVQAARTHSLEAPGVEGQSPTEFTVLRFDQRLPGRKRPMGFLSISMSDGTLRALGILTALLQDGDRGPTDTSPTLVAIEEPEMALHPAALGILIDALQDASERMQVLVTTHSPDLLHSAEVDTEELLAVSAESGYTTIGRVDEGSRSILAQRLFTPGELLRLGDLEPDPGTRELDDPSLRIFEH